MGEPYQMLAFRASCAGVVLRRSERLVNELQGDTETGKGEHRGTGEPERGREGAESSWPLAAGRKQRTEERTPEPRAEQGC